MRKRRRAALDFGPPPPMLAPAMVVSGTVPARAPRRIDPYRLAVWVRRVTLLGTVAIGLLCWFTLGTEWVPAGMRTVPDIQPGSLCVVDRRASAATVGRDVFVRVDGVLLLSRVAAVDGAALTLANPDQQAPWPDSRAFGPVPRRQVVGTVLFAITHGVEARRRG